MTQTEEVLAMDGPLHPDLVRWWEEFLSRGRSVLDLFESPLHPLQRMREMLWMMRTAHEFTRCEVVMEIGADKGGGAFAWARLMPRLRSLCVCEIRGVPYVDVLQKSFPSLNLLGLAASSYDRGTVEGVELWLEGDRIDALFLDGDKSWFDRDFDCYLPLMAKPGVVFFHDITDPAPREAYDKVCARGYKHEEHVDRSEVLSNLGNSAYSHWLRHWNGASCGVGVVYLG